jgi:hypothetical protein
MKGIGSQKFYHDVTPEHQPLTHPRPMQSAGSLKIWMADNRGGKFCGQKKGMRHAHPFCKLVFPNFTTLNLQWP